MRLVRTTVFFFTIMLLALATAHSGAIVDKGTWDILGGTEYNEDEGLLLVTSTFADWCDAEGAVMLLPWMEVIRPADQNEDSPGGKYRDSGFFYTRVLMSNPDDFWAIWWPEDWAETSMCAIWSNPDLWVADGITHSTYNDNDLSPYHPNRRNVWGYTVSGGLQNFSDDYDCEIVGVNFVRRMMLVDDDWPNCIPECEIKVKTQGPRLSCDD